MSGYRAVVAPLFALLVVACAGPAAPVSTASPPPGIPNARPTAQPEPILTLVPTPQRADYWTDEAFAAAADEACQVARPLGVEDLREPTRPLDKGPEYGKVHLVVTDLIGEDGTIEDAPVVPTGQFFYDLTLSGYPFDFTDVLPTSPDVVDLLACIALRIADSRSYSMPVTGLQVEVHNVDSLVWMIDPVSSEMVGRPWLVPSSGFPMALDPAGVLHAGDYSLLVPSGNVIAWNILSYLGRVRPYSGAFQGGQTHDGHYYGGPLAYEDEVMLAAGTEVYEETFVLRLVVLEALGDTVDFIEVFCVSDGTITGDSLQVARDVPIEFGRFEAESGDISLAGDFTYSTGAVGIIAAHSSAAIECGVPEAAEWTAYYELDARPAGDSYVLELRQFPEE
jgi:hypothetical protein